MKTTVETAKLAISVMPGAARAPELSLCGLCGRETYLTLTLSDDHPVCCRHCFRGRVAQVRPRRVRA